MVSAKLGSCVFLLCTPDVCGLEGYEVNYSRKVNELSGDLLRFERCDNVFVCLLPFMSE